MDNIFLNFAIIFIKHTCVFAVVVDTTDYFQKINLLKFKQWKN